MGVQVVLLHAEARPWVANAVTDHGLDVGSISHPQSRRTAGDLTGTPGAQAES